MSLFDWIVEVVKHPRELSTVFPSSPFLARTVADQLDLSEPRAIAELGAGDGALTGPIVKRMSPGSQLHLIEVNERFVRRLEETYRDHAKADMIHVHRRRAEDLGEIAREAGLEGFDYVVSGLPLTTLPDEVSDAVLETTFRGLKPDGRYVQFQYSQDYRKAIEERFGPIDLHRVWLNVLPAWVYVADKARAPSVENSTAGEAHTGSSDSP